LGRYGDLESDEKEECSLISEMKTFFEGGLSSLRKDLTFLGVKNSALTNSSTFSEWH
jgi:hypothetical protein